MFNFINFGFMVHIYVHTTTDGDGLGPKVFIYNNSSFSLTNSLFT